MSRRRSLQKQIPHATPLLRAVVRRGAASQTTSLPLEQTTVRRAGLGEGWGFWTVDPLSVAAPCKQAVRARRSDREGVVLAYAVCAHVGRGPCGLWWNHLERLSGKPQWGRFGVGCVARETVWAAVVVHCVVNVACGAALSPQLPPPSLERKTPLGELAVHGSCSRTAAAVRIAWYDVTRACARAQAQRSRQARTKTWESSRRTSGRRWRRAMRRVFGR